MRLPDGVFAVMSAVDRELGLAGVKSYAWLPGGTPFVVLLFDTEKAVLAGVIEADKMGQLRTGAASGVAAKYLAKPDARTLGVIGCGWQAETQVACIREALPGNRARRRLLPHGEEPARVLQEGRRRGRREPPGPGGAGRRRHRDHLEGSRSCAESGFSRARSSARVGANEPRARELDNVVLERAVFVCCDSVEQARLESGDLIEPVDRGVLDWLEVHELQEVVAGELAGRSSPDDIVVFKSNGLAAWDVAIGHAALERAREQEVGRDGLAGVDPGRRDDVVAERSDQLRSVEQTRLLRRRDKRFRT